MNPWEMDYGPTTTTEAPPWEQDYGVTPTAEAQPEGDQLHQFEPPGMASRALEAARQYLSPILGRTELQRLNEGPRDAEGLLPAMSKPIIPLPKYEHQPGDGKLVGLGKAIGNTALGFAEFIESPLGIATGGVGSAVPAAMRATAGRLIAGGFAADLGSKLPEAIGTTRQTLNNPNAPFGQKAEAVLGTTAQGLIVAGTGYHAARGRSVNAEAANLEREVTAGATPKTEAAVMPAAAKPWEQDFTSGLNEAPATVASGGSPVERFIYEAKAKAGEEATATTQRGATAEILPEPMPWEMEYAGGEMPRTSAIGGELPNEKTQSQGKTREVLTPPAELDSAPQTAPKNVPAAAMEATPVTEAKPAPPEQSVSITPPEVSTTGRGAGKPAPASSSWKSKKSSQTLTGSNAQTGAEMQVPAKPGEAILTQGQRVRAGNIEGNLAIYDDGRLAIRNQMGEFPVTFESIKPLEAAKPVETPAQAAGKVAEHVAEVASGEKAVKTPANKTPTTGPRPAKEIKSELVQRLEEQVEKAKSEQDLTPAQQEALKSAKNFTGRGCNGDNRQAIREVQKANAARRDELVNEAQKSGVERVTVEIPGDGTFTIWNTKEALSEVLARAKKLSTSAEPSKNYRESGIGKEDREWVANNKQTLEGWADKVLSEDPRKRSRTGLDPAEEARRLAAVAIKGSYLIARGVRDFAQWTAEIIKQIPELAAKSEAELRRLYAQAVDIAEGRDPQIGLSIRGMKVQADTSLSEAVRENVDAAYTKRVAADDIAEAKRLITAAGGPEAAAKDMLAGLWKPVDQTVQVKGAGEVLAGLAKLEAQAGENTARVNDLADLQVRIADHSTRMATMPAQWLQAFSSLYANYSPAAWLKEWRNGINGAARDRIERATGQKTGETPTEMAQGIADAVAEGIAPDAPTTAKVIEAVFGTKGEGQSGPGGKAPETAVQAVERIIGQKGEQAQKTARKIQDFYEREVAKFKRKHKIPELTPEDQRNILAEAKAIQRLPADSLQRREAVLRLLDQLHRRKGFEWWELPLGFWYANTLSGPTTHAKNILGNSLNLGMEAGLQTMLKPTNLPIILESLGRSLSVGTAEAWSILKTGHDTSSRHGDKFELRRNALELQNGTLDKVLLPWKLVGRFLRAEDAVFFNAGQELRAAILSKRANGESTATARKAMGWTPEARAKAEAQATAEGLTGLNLQRRTNEIIEQGRPGEVMNPARDFGYDVTFNNEPYGVLGAFTSAINRGFDAAPVLKPFILPFTRIVANVSNSSLNWTPVGNYRALRGQRKLAWLGRAENSGKLYGREINDPLAIRDAHARALVGTAAMIGVTAAAIRQVFDPTRGREKLVASAAA